MIYKGKGCTSINTSTPSQRQTIVPISTSTRGYSYQNVSAVPGYRYVTSDGQIFLTSTNGYLYSEEDGYSTNPLMAICYENQCKYVIYDSYEFQEFRNALDDYADNYRNLETTLGTEIVVGLASAIAGCGFATLSTGGVGLALCYEIVVVSLITTGMMIAGTLAYFLYILTNAEYAMAANYSMAIDKCKPIRYRK